MSSRITIEEAQARICAAFPAPIECTVEILDRANSLSFSVRSAYGAVSASGLVKSQVCDPRRLERIIAFMREAIDEKAMDDR